MVTEVTPEQVDEFCDEWDKRMVEAGFGHLSSSNWQQALVIAGALMRERRRSKVRLTVIDGGKEGPDGEAA